MEYIITFIIVGLVFGVLRLFIRLRVRNSEISGKWQFLIIIVVSVILTYIRTQFY